MPRNTSVTPGEHFDKFVAEKIEALRARLEAGEHSPPVENFSKESFLAELRKKANKR